MTRIFIEAKSDKTSESVFIHTLLKYLHKDESTYEVVHVDGKDNLVHQKVKFQENSICGGRNIIVFDADTKNTKGGYSTTLERITNTFNSDVNIDDIFLYPNNHDDGIFENLLEYLTLKDVNKKFFDCFSDYEACLGDDYISPDIKGKIFTYMSAQKSLSKTQRKKLGSGQWLFDDTRYWNLDVEELKPLKDFFNANVL